MDWNASARKSLLANRDAQQVLMPWRDKQTVDQSRVKHPEKMHEAVLARCGFRSLAAAQLAQRQRRAEELDVVMLIRPPDAKVVLEVLGKLHEDFGEWDNADPRAGAYRTQIAVEYPQVRCGGVWQAANGARRLVFGALSTDVEDLP